ncbi:MAG: hypothetical protein AAF629_29755 [Chloroflexota bacterium]
MGKRQNATIVHITDDPTDGLLVQAVLRKHRNDNVILCDPEKQLASAIIKEEKPDLILLNSILLTIDSIQRYHQLKNTLELKDTPILLWRVAMPKRFTSLANDLGIAGFLSIPIEVKTIIEARDKLLLRATYYH